MFDNNCQSLDLNPGPPCVGGDHPLNCATTNAPVATLLHYKMMNRNEILLYGCRHSSVDSAAPSILPPRV